MRQNGSQIHHQEEMLRQEASEGKVVLLNTRLQQMRISKQEQALGKGMGKQHESGQVREQMRKPETTEKTSCHKEQRLSSDCYEEHE